MNSISCLDQPAFRSLAAIVSENPLFSLFPVEKPILQILTFPLNRTRSTQGHHLKKKYDRQEYLMHHTIFRRNRSSGSRDEDIRRVFTIYGHGGHLIHVTQIP